MKFTTAMMAAASLALVLPYSAAVAQRGGHGGGGFHGGGFRGGGYGYRGGYGGRGGYGYRGYGYGGYGYGLLGLGLLGGYALGTYSNAYDGYAPYAYEVEPELYDAPPPPPAGYVAGAGSYDDGDNSAAPGNGAAASGDGAHCPMFWDQSQKRYIPRCG